MPPAPASPPPPSPGAPSFRRLHLGGKKLNGGGEKIIINQINKKNTANEGSAQRRFPWQWLGSYGEDCSEERSERTNHNKKFTFMDGIHMTSCGQSNL